MKNWNLLFRRTHLYLGLLLLPWMLMYAASTVLFNHGDSFRKFRAADPQWLPLWEKDCVVDLPSGNDGLREAARRILDENGLAGAFGAQRQGQRLTINVHNFRQPLRLTYEGERGKLRAERKAFAWIEVLIRLHQRIGYGHPGLLNTLWAVLVDLFCVATLAWIGTGLYLWWKLPVTRGWGWLALGGGLASIAILLGTL
jgi:hypothetical protein